MSEKIIVKVDPELEELIPSYLQNLEKNTANIKAGLAKDDMELCRTLGHNMKGSGGSYGFDFVSAMGKEIEDAARTAKNEEIKNCIEKLEDYLKHIEVQCAS